MEIRPPPARTKIGALACYGSQREDERPQNDRLGPTFVKEITTNHPNEPDVRSVHYRVIPLT